MSFEPEECVSPRVDDLYNLMAARIRELKQYSVLQPVIFELWENPQLKVLNRDLNQAALELEQFSLVANAASFCSYIEEIRGPDRPVSLRTAPGSRMNYHHAFPGGLIFHIAADLEHALATAEVYQRIYGVLVEREILIAAMALHDIAKPCVFPWRPDGTYPDEMSLAGTSGHHIFSASEAIYRGLPLPIIRAMLFCHAGVAAPQTDLQKYVTAAYIIAGQKPPHAENWPITLEDWICMYADSDGDIIGWLRGQLAQDVTLQGMDNRMLYTLLAAWSDVGLYQDLKRSIRAE